MKEEKYIKEKLTDYESPMDMGAMWADLEKNLDEKEDRKGGFWIWGKGLLMSLGLLAIVSILFFTFRSSTIDKHPISENKISNTQNNIPTNTGNKQTLNTPKSDTKSTNLISKSKNETGSNNKKENKTAPLQDSTRKTTSSNNRNASKANKTINSKSLYTTNQITTAPVSKSVAQAKKPRTEKSSTITIASSDSVSKSKKSDETKSIEANKDENLMAQFAMLAGNHSFLNWNRVLDMRFPSIVLPKASRIRVPKEKKVSWRGRINYGLTLSDPIFSGLTDAGITEDVFITKLNEKLLSTTNHTFGIGVERVTNKGLKLSLDLNYMNHGYIYADNAEIEAIIEQETSTVYISDGGSFIGEDEIIVESQDGYYFWNYRDYRGWDAFQAPIMIGYETRRNNFDLSISAGPALNFLRQSDEILNYNELNIELAERAELNLVSLETESIFKQNTFLLSATTKAELGYRLRKKLRIFTSVEAGRLLSDVSSNGDAIAKLNHFGMRTGVSYEF